MGSVSSVNPGVADLLQTLSNLGTPVVSSTGGISALENASPTDLVQLTSAATQLEGVEEMFGTSQGADSGTNNTSIEDLLAGAIDSAANPSSSSTTSSSAASAGTTSAAQLASYQTAVDAAATQSLLDSSGSSSLTGSLFDEIG